MSRAIVIRSGAMREIARIARSISAHVSDTSARRWRNRIESAIADLAFDAVQWPEADEAAKLGHDLRCRYVGRRRHVYRILFFVHVDTVEVLRIRHSSQDYLTADDL